MRVTLVAACFGFAPVVAGQLSFANEARGPLPAVAVPASPAAPRPLSPEVRGDISMARKDYRQAIDYYRSIEPANQILFNKIGIAFHQLGELDSARKYYEKSIKSNAGYAEAVNNLGTVYYATKSYRKAIRQYNRALHLAPNSASIYSNLGTAYFARKNYRKAAEAYQRALSLDPEVFERRSTNGVLLQDRSVEERAKFHYYLAKTYAKAGMTDRALLYMRKCLEEGFKDRQKFVEEPDFAQLQQIPEFQELLQYQPRVL